MSYILQLEMFHWKLFNCAGATCCGPAVAQQLAAEAPEDVDETAGGQAASQNGGAGTQGDGRVTSNVAKIFLLGKKNHLCGCFGNTRM